ncbi:MAG: hypothetical protein ABIQ99_17660 [Thermoflexales bacterium]
MTYTLTFVDVSAIQAYVFGSNRLTHQLGASYLVEQALHGWIADALTQTNQGEIDKGADCEIVYRGGGNACILFKSRDGAKAFATQYTRGLLTQAPGLTVVIAHQDFDWNTSLAVAYNAAMTRLAKKKAAEMPAMETLGLGVTAACAYTGLPVVGKEDDRYVSEEIRAKQNSSEVGRSRLLNEFKSARGDYDFVTDFNLFGEQGTAYMAVVHADGNGMGRRKKALVERFARPDQNRGLIQALQQFSAELNRAGSSALNKTIEALKDWLAKPALPDERSRHTYIRHDQNDASALLLPIVPIIFGGDDVTFVCDGRLGLSLATQYLRAFDAETVGGPPLHACAGIAIVGSRFPFARAYEMAEALCRSAKRYAKKEGADRTALDWHIAVNGAVRSIEDIRQREYTADAGTLTLRPLMLGDDAKAADKLRTWSNFTEVATALRTSRDWAESRNKLKTLRDPLRQGPQATQLFLQSIRKTLPPLAGYPDAQRTGWAGPACAYFDAIEALDRFVDMEE